MRFVAAMVLGLALWILSGCGNSALLMLDKNENFKKALDNTKKQQLKDQTETLAIFRATYLNPIYPDKYRDREYFFVGIHIQNDMNNDQAGINNPLYNLTLNDQNLSGYEEVDDTHELYKSMPLVERWTHYYIVQFDDNATGNLNLVYKKDTKQSLKFTYPRYVNP